MNERIRCVTRSSTCVALCTLALLIATHTPTVVINVICVGAAAIVTSIIMFNRPSRVSWAIIIYLVSIFFTVIMGGLSRPMALLAYAIVIAPYVMFHIWISELTQNYLVQFIFKFVVMTGLCILFFLTLSPLISSVGKVLDIMASLPMKWFNLDRTKGIVVIFSFCAVAGGTMIPFIDLLFKRVKKSFNLVA